MDMCGLTTWWQIQRKVKSACSGGKVRQALPVWETTEGFTKALQSYPWSDFQRKSQQVWMGTWPGASFRQRGSRGKELEVQGLAYETRELLSVVCTYWLVSQRSDTPEVETELKFWNVLWLLPCHVICKFSRVVQIFLGNCSPWSLLQWLIVLLYLYLVV